MNRQEMRQYIEDAPYPLSGLPIPERAHGEEGYSLAARSAARAMLIVCEEDSSLLEVPSKEEDPSGIKRAFHDAHWKVALERWPGLDDWLGGITGFQWGWANNCVRYILGAEPVGNPAVTTIEIEDKLNL